MKIIKITAGFTAKMPTQPFGNIELPLVYEAELEEGDDPVACTKALFAMAKEQAREQVKPLVATKARLVNDLLGHIDAAERGNYRQHLGTLEMLEIIVGTGNDE